MRNFFKSYRKTAAAPSDVIESIFVPFTRRFEYTAAYKQVCAVQCRAVLCWALLCCKAPR